MKESTRNYMLLGLGAIAAAFVVDDRIRPLGLARINPLTLWRLRNVQKTQDALIARASAPQLSVQQRAASTQASTIFRQNAAARAMGL